VKLKTVCIHEQKIVPINWKGVGPLSPPSLSSPLNGWHARRNCVPRVVKSTAPIRCTSRWRDASADAHTTRRFCFVRPCGQSFSYAVQSRNLLGEMELTDRVWCCHLLCYSGNRIIFALVGTSGTDVSFSICR